MKWHSVGEHMSSPSTRAWKLWRLRELLEPLPPVSRRRVLAVLLKLHAARISGASSRDVTMPLLSIDRVAADKQKGEI
jgi:hypothetical protein